MIMIYKDMRRFAYHKKKRTLMTVINLTNKNNEAKLEFSSRSLIDVLVIIDEFNSLVMDCNEL